MKKYFNAYANLKKLCTTCNDVYLDCRENQVCPCGLKSAKIPTKNHPLEIKTLMDNPKDKHIPQTLRMLGLI